ncbi:MAG: phosphate acyltransferase PlsX [Clostridiales Family XIII bacterium]|nr:phosphate acyltransferase PlsX [Clostridiales Family XIII bacterium]
MRIILDGMGGDHAPAEIVKGAAITSKLIGHEIVIVGDEEAIRRELDTVDHNSQNISIVHASEVITFDDSPVKAIRQKKDSSLVKGLMMVKEGEGDMIISAGNSGAIMTGGLLLLGRIEGIERPALGSVYPFMEKGGAGLLIDAGANSECKPHNLLHFATMGSIYMEKVLGLQSPKVGLVNMGTEPSKGGKVLKETYVLLEESRKEGINFIGNIEGRTVPTGIADVIVCDGMTGNIILKLTEGLALTIMDLLKQKFTDGAVAKIGAGLLYGKMKELKELFDYTEYGGAPILGIKHPVIKIHGSSNANAVRSGIMKAIPFVENEVIATITEAIKKVDSLEESLHGEASS